MDQLEEWRGRVEARLDSLLPRPETPPCTLHEAMRHALLSGGKRLRALLCLAACRAVLGQRRKVRELSPPETGTGERESGTIMDPIPAVAAAEAEAEKVALDAGCAVELLHAYTLIHDDLPSMDNDDLRRGRLSCHKAFGEAAAILAGDALQALSFEALADAATVPAGAAARREAGDAVRLLAAAAGSQGVCGGQMLDLEGEGRPATAQDAQAIARWKTAALIAASCGLGGWAAGADAAGLAVLRRFAEAAGVMYQVVDDILDATQSTKALGKTAGKDARLGKTTHVAALGLDGARRRADEYRAQAQEALSPLGEAAGLLRELLDLMARRVN